MLKCCRLCSTSFTLIFGCHRPIHFVYSLCSSFLYVFSWFLGYFAYFLPLDSHFSRSFLLSSSSSLYLNFLFILCKSFAKLCSKCFEMFSFIFYDHFRSHTIESWARNHDLEPRAQGKMIFPKARLCFFLSMTMIHYLTQALLGESMSLFLCKAQLCFLFNTTVLRLIL